MVHSSDLPSAAPAAASGSGVVAGQDCMTARDRKNCASGGGRWEVHQRRPQIGYRILVENVRSAITVAPGPRQLYDVTAAGA